MLVQQKEMFLLSLFLFVSTSLSLSHTSILKCELNIKAKSGLRVKGGSKGSHPEYKSSYCCSTISIDGACYRAKPN